MNKNLRKTVPDHFFGILQDLNIKYTICLRGSDRYGYHKNLMTFYFILCDYKDSQSIETFIGNFCMKYKITKNKYHKNLQKYFTENYPEYLI